MLEQGESLATARNDSQTYHSSQEDKSTTASLRSKTDTMTDLHIKSDCVRDQVSNCSELRDAKRSRSDIGEVQFLNSKKARYGAVTGKEVIVYDFGCARRYVDSVSVPTSTHLQSVQGV